MTKLAVLALLAAPLYEQSVARLLRERFSEARISYLFADARAGRLVDSRWDDLARPVPVGSLVKPFLALAYGETHQFRYPEVVCRGKAGGCWLACGHGRIGVTDAVAHSCNAYFRALAAQVRWDDVASLAQRFGLEGPPAGATAATLAGLGSAWRISPAALVRAYCRLVADPRAEDLVRGMALSARSGTGRAVGIGLVKTGTAPCTHRVKAPGDGYVIAFYPAVSPRYALLVRVHGIPGADAAAIAGQMLRVVRAGK